MIEISKHLEQRLSTHPMIARLFGRFYARLAERGQLTEDLLPTDWEWTERSLDEVVRAVILLEAAMIGPELILSPRVSAALRLYET